MATMNTAILSRHDQGVAYYARQLVQKGWMTVYSHLPGNLKPPTINGRIPDIYARHGVQELVIEVETSKALPTAHTAQQAGAFRAWAGLSPNTRRFQLLVY